LWKDTVIYYAKKKKVVSLYLRQDSENMY